MASNKRRPDMHWDRPVADVKRVVNVKRGTAEDVVMYLGPCGPLDRETRRQEAAAVAALRDGDEAANVWGIAARLWINATDRESNRTATGCACTTDRAAAEDRKAAALLGPRGSGRIKGWRAALRARRAEVAVDALKCERRPAEAAEGGTWGRLAGDTPGRLSPRSHGCRLPAVGPVCQYPHGKAGATARLWKGNFHPNKTLMSWIHRYSQIQQMRLTSPCARTR